MFVIDEDKTIHLTRGDMAVISVSVKDGDEDYNFSPGDKVRFRILKTKDCETIILQKDIDITEETTVADISLTKEDTKIGDLINKPAKYWYEIELNPDTKPQTIVGYDKDGPKIFTLYPEGGDVE